MPDAPPFEQPRLSPDAVRIGIHTVEWKRIKLLPALPSRLVEESHAASAWTPDRNIDAPVLSVARSRLSGECLFRLLPARAISTPAAGVGGFSLLTMLVYVADEYPAIYARAGTQAL